MSRAVHVAPETRARPASRAGHRPGLLALVRDLVDGMVRLARQEVRLARIELGQIASAVARGTGLVAAGATFAVIGGLAIVVGITLMLGDWLANQFWLSALIVTAALAIAAVVLAKRGADLLTPARLAPDETLETLRDDREWLEREVRRLRGDDHPAPRPVARDVVVTDGAPPPPR